MLKTVLLWLGVIIVILLVLLWFITGGVGKTVQAARGITNPLYALFSYSTSTGSFFRLPWQPEGLTLGPDVSDIMDAEDAMEPKTPEEELAESQEEYARLVSEAERAKTFGEPSPHRGKVRIGEGGAAEGRAAEYVELEASPDNTAPVSLGGWSLQSALTGIRAYIPRGAEIFIMGDVNAQKDIYLDPGATAVASSPASPVGTSFRENACTGYLRGLQAFTPPLSRSCPPPAESLPLTPDNLRTYGDACYDFVQTLPPCTFPLSPPPGVAPACRIFLANNLSYNGCVQNYRHASGFARDAWRIYLNAGGELWRNSHDIIRLLDAEGRTVDVVSY